MTCKKQNIALALLMCLFLLSLRPFYIRVADCFLHPEQQNTTDMDIFAGAAKNYLRTGELYQRSDNYQKTYAPGEGVYKFPPAYQLTILPLLKLYPDNFEFLFVQRLIQLVLYLGASILLIMTIGKIFIWQKQPFMHKTHRYQSCQFILIALLMTMWSMGFFESFSGIEPEILIFFLLALALYFSESRPLVSGALIAAATAIKIYPIFMLLYFVFRAKSKGVAGFLVGFLFISACSVYYVGIDEHVFYIKNIFPELLREKPIYHIQNKSMESFFYSIDLISGISGKITIITKVTSLLLIVLAGFFLDKKSADRCALFFAMLVSGTLLCLTNYWQQYHIILAIPYLCLIAYSLKNKTYLFFLILIVTAAATSLQEAWLQNLKDNIMNEELPKNIAAINNYMTAHPHSDPVLIFFPFLWLLFRLRDWVFLAPAIYFILSGLMLAKSK